MVFFSQSSLAFFGIKFSTEGSCVFAGSEAGQTNESYHRKMENRELAQQVSEIRSNGIFRAGLIESLGCPLDPKVEQSSCKLKRAVFVCYRSHIMHMLEIRIIR